MRKLFFAILIITAISSFYFAQPSSARADETRTFVGTIGSVRIAPLQFRSGPPFWPFMKLEVVADNGEKKNFFICGPGPHVTIFYDIDGNVIKVQNIKVAEIGKKVEVKYIMPAEIMKWADKQLAISVRYIPADYVPQSAAPATGQAVSSPAPAPEPKMFVGTVKDVSAVLGREPNWTYNRIEVLGNNGDKADFFVMRKTVIADVDGKDLSGKRVQKGKKVEIKYSMLTDSSYIINGQRGADSIRYVAADYVPQPTASTTGQVVLNSAPSVSVASNAGNNIFVGKVVKGGGTFGLRCPYRFTFVADNGETKEFWIPNENFYSRIGGINGVLPAKGKK